MNYELIQGDQFAAIKIKADKFDSRLAPEIKTQITLLLKDSVKNLIIDLSDCRFCDSSGLSAILLAKRLCEEKKGSMVVVNTSTHINHLIHISQLSKILVIVPTFNEAVDYIYMDEIGRSLEKEDPNNQPDV